MPRVARRHVKDPVSNWRAISSSSSVTKRVTASRLEAIAGPWYFFSKPCCAPFVENARSSSAGRYGRTTNLRLQNIGKERGSPQVKSMLNALGKTDRCLVGVVLFARLECLRRTLPILRGSDWDPARQTETCECELCVILALRS